MIGHFRVTVKKHPRYIDESTCTGCGDCVLVCPVEVYNRFDAGIGVRKAIYKPHAQAVPDIVIKDPDHCIECGLCYDVCGPGSVRREDKEQEIVIDAASIVLTTGYSVFDAGKKPQFSHLRLPDVVTSLETGADDQCERSDRWENPADEYRGNPEKCRSSSSAWGPVT